MVIRWEAGGDSAVAAADLQRVVAGAPNGLLTGLLPVLSDCILRRSIKGDSFRGEGNNPSSPSCSSLWCCREQLHNSCTVQLCNSFRKPQKHIQRTTTVHAENSLNSCTGELQQTQENTTPTPVSNDSSCRTPWNCSCEGTTTCTRHKEELHLSVFFVIYLFHCFPLRNVNLLSIFTKPKRTNEVVCPGDRDTLVRDVGSCYLHFSRKRSSDLIRLFQNLVYSLLLPSSLFTQKIIVERPRELAFLPPAFFPSPVVVKEIGFLVLVAVCSPQVHRRLTATCRMHGCQAPDTA